MTYDLRMPQTTKEGLLYGSVICSTTVLVMSSFNIYLQFQELSLPFVLTVLKAFPLFFVGAMLLEKCVVSHFTDQMMKRYSDPADSFNGQLLFSIVFTVIGMSCIMTFLGDVVGHGFKIEAGILSRYVNALPRNFSIVLLVETLLAQPLARKVMLTIHTY